MPSLYETLRTRHQPDVLVIHPGENDLVALLAVQFLDNFTWDIALMKDLLCGTRLVWVDMLLNLHLAWGSALARRKANIVGSHHGAVMMMNQRGI